MYEKPGFGWKWSWGGGYGIGGRNYPTALNYMIIPEVKNNEKGDLLAYKTVTEPRDSGSIQVNSQDVKQW